MITFLFGATLGYVIHWGHEAWLYRRGRALCRRDDVRVMLAFDAAADEACGVANEGRLARQRAAFKEMNELLDEPEHDPALAEEFWRVVGRDV